ncbi:MarR family transcriptional regulator [Raineyella fluvialis]|uniref:MarR family transcriptional regulator n=1 Tax=Raineyella fluvialis TaxID=2662261 RepID=A0A5Q2FG97_9ACTN|nr:MarR family transcriptional regulator [Raineyella fluvialis]QGF24133.1 MarR family transcriptional regulator [Raineyella fluvialis]
MTRAAERMVERPAGVYGGAMREQQDRPIGYWAKHLDTLINQEFERILHEDDVTRRQWQTLTTLSWGARTVASLRETLSAFRCDEDDSLEAALEVLSRRGWLHDDGATLSLTEAGLAAHEEVRGHVESIREELARGISEADYRTTVDTLRQMCDNLAGVTEAH